MTPTGFPKIPPSTTPVTNADDKMREEIYRREEELMNGTPSPFDAPPSQTAPMPAIDPVAEQQAFADLLKFFTDDDDDGTAVEALTAEQFSEETYTVPNPDDPSDEAAP